jgi:gliding motility-associated-like protein
VIRDKIIWCVFLSVQFFSVYGNERFCLCSVIAKCSPASDTIVSNSNPIIFENQSLNSSSVAWYINGLFAASTDNLTVSPLTGVNEIMLVASNGTCSDTTYTYVFLEGTSSGQNSYFQKQYNPVDKAMEPFCLAADKSKGYLLAGDYYMPSVNNSITRTSSLIHIDENGCIDWSKAMVEGEEQVIQSAISTQDSGFLITSFPFQSTQDNYPSQLNVFKLDKTGNKIWSHSFSSGTAVNNYYSALCETQDDNIIIEVGSFPIAANPTVVSLIKIDPLGNLVWSRKFGVEDNSFYNIGGVTEKNNFIYATGSISEGVSPFQVIRSFFMQVDESTGIPVWTKQNDPLKPPLSFTDIHNYKSGLLINSYSQNLINNLIYTDVGGNISDGLTINNPYGSLNGKENIVVASDNAIYFHQPSGMQGPSHKDIIMRIDSTRQIDWQYDFTTGNHYFSGWNQLYAATANGVAGIGSGVMSNGFNTLTFLKMDSMGTSCNSGTTNLSLQPEMISMSPLTWNVNSNLSLTVTDFDLSLENISIESHLFCPKYMSGCDLLKLAGPSRICNAGDTARYVIHSDPSCEQTLNWTYDTSRISVLSVNHGFLDLRFKSEGSFLIKVSKTDCNEIEDSIFVVVGDTTSKINLPKDTVLCEGQSMKLDAGNGYSDYLWQDGTTGQSIIVRNSGNYSVLLTDKSGCVRRDTTVIGSLKPLPVSFLPADTTFCAGEILNLQPVHSFDSYIWNTGDKSSSIQIKNPGIYSLKVTDKYGCIGEDTILVKSKSCPLEIFFPNAFTPNKDGRNDLFKPIIFATPITYQFRIYNRWGQVIFETADPAKGWDGYIGSIRQDGGTYIWICAYQFTGHKKNVAQGTVLLLR